MMLQLLLALAAFRVAQAEFKSCPEDSACLYHARCSNPFETGENVLATTIPDAIEDWNCTKSSTTTALFVRPLSNHKWNLTLETRINDAGISFGDSLTVMTNQTEAIFKADSDAAIKIPIEKKKITFTLTVEYFKKKLLDIFKNTNVSYIESDMLNGSTFSDQRLFWERIHQLTPCNASLIFDDCTNGTANCTALDFNVKDSVGCPTGEGGTMWLKSTNSTWEHLATVSCHSESKEWTMANENGTLPNGTVPAPAEGFEIRCATVKPEPWAVSATGLVNNLRVVKKTEEERETFSLMDSPYTWVGIGLAAIISMAAVVLISVYAFRKFGRNTDKSSKSKGKFTALPQETSATGASISNSECDQRNGKADQTPVPTPTPSATSKTPGDGPGQTPVPSSAPPASRIDGPAANTVTKLSMIKTLEESKMAPIPAPPAIA